MAAGDVDAGGEQEDRQDRQNPFEVVECAVQRLGLDQVFRVEQRERRIDRRKLVRDGQPVGGKIVLDLVDHGAEAEDHLIAGDHDGAVLLAGQGLGELSMRDRVCPDPDPLRIRAAEELRHSGVNEAGHAAGQRPREAGNQTAEPGRAPLGQFGRGLIDVSLDVDLARDRGGYVPCTSLPSRPCE